ncbi:hypothetical protein DRN85_06655 [Methanosarcinales archaeon]|nr:MAG: hypothetical protein DRN85_06655 [Methanosarcinales archaeon]
MDECRNRIRELREEIKRIQRMMQKTANDPFREFVKEMCVVSNETKISTDELYKAFLLFREIVLNMDGQPPSKTRLSRFLSNEYNIHTVARKVRDIGKRKSQRFYKGITLKV